MQFGYFRALLWSFLWKLNEYYIRIVYIVQNNNQAIFLLQNNSLYIYEYYKTEQISTCWKYYFSVLSSITVDSSQNSAETFTCVRLSKYSMMCLKEFPMQFLTLEWRKEQIERRVSKVGFQDLSQTLSLRPNRFKMECHNLWPRRRLLRIYLIQIQSILYWMELHFP